MVQISNQTRNKIISKEAKFAITFFDRLLGLLNPNNPRYLILKTHFGIHTFFMKEDIDVLILDRNQRVKILKENLKPNTLFLYSPKYSRVIEMPRQSIKKNLIRINDKISIE